MSTKGRIGDQKWECIFKEKNILNYLQRNQLFEISSKEIKKYREPRLMTKFDHYWSLPEIFRDNKLGILPISKRDYVIGHFDLYSSFKKKPYQLKDTTVVTFPDWIETIDINNIHTEPEMISVAVISGMLQKLFGFNDGIHLSSTVNGRMSTGDFSFVINGIPIKVNGSQMEIDAGFEVADALIIIEAKLHQADTFLIRQLYYPYRVWSQRVSKKVIPIYLQYDNGIFNFSIFDFEDPNDYRSIKLLSRQNFVVEQEKLLFKDLLNTYQATSNKLVAEPNYDDCPFPQANSLDKLLESIDYLLNNQDKLVTKGQLSAQLDIVPRQADYYTNAGKYLNIFNYEHNAISLTKKGLEFYGKAHKERLLLLASLLFQHLPFRKTFAKIIQQPNRKVTVPEIVTILEEDPAIFCYTAGVRRRRASTVKSWLTYLIESCDN